MNLLRFQMPPIALSNHALRAKFLSAFFCFPSLFVSAIPRINGRLLANEKTDSEELVSRPYQAQWATWYIFIHHSGPNIKLLNSYNNPYIPIYYIYIFFFW